MPPSNWAARRGSLLLPDATVFVPLFVLFLTSLNGTSLTEAFANAWTAVTVGESAWLVWCQVIGLNVVLYTYALPVFRTHIHQSFGKPLTPGQIDMAMKHLNGMTPFVILTSVAVFVAGQIAHTALNPPDFSIANVMMLTSMSLDLGQAAGNGLLVGVILALQFDNRLYRARETVVSLGPRVRLAYRSLYATIFVVLAAIVVFLSFQIFSSAGSFFAVGTKGIGFEGPRLGKIMTAPEMVFQSALSSTLKSTLDVFGVRLMLMIAIAALLLWQLKFLFRNPIDTVQQRLAVLNSPAPGDLSEIAIVQNDEFACVYEEINVLIQRQQDRVDLTRKRLEDIINCAADPIVAYDRQGVLRLVNSAAHVIFQMSQGSMLGLSVEGLFPGGSAALKTAHAAGAARLPWNRCDGTTILLESTLSEGGDDLEFWTTAILRDVTLQAELEATLTRARTEAERANHQKSEFLANMSHELRTPLNAILGFTQLLENDKNLTDGQVERIRVISRSGEHLLGLINDILDISKIEAGKMEIHNGIFDLPQFVGDLKELFALKCRSKGLTLYVETLDDVPRFVEGDLGKLRQVMINLVGNAVKFTAEGGVSVLVGREGARIRFAVKDTGRGIPLDEQQKILQPFVQASTTDHEGGTGLGLAISSRYIEMMGGKLAVESAPGEGSTFSFHLPLEVSAVGPDNDNGEDAAIAIKPGHAVTVLVVDDQLANRLVLKEMLDHAGFTVVEAANGQQAVERAREMLPAIVFMDIKMPVMDGYEAVTALKSDPVTAALRVFALTASAFSHDEARILNSGFDGFLAKPFKQNALYRLIRDKGNVTLEYLTAAPDNGPDLTPPGPEDFAAAKASLSAQALANLDDAALINDFATVAKLAEAQKDHSPRFFAALKRAANNYEEGSIADLLGALK